MCLGVRGALGHTFIQIAKIKGAKITAICTRSNMKKVLELGADAAIAFDDAGVNNLLIKSVDLFGKYHLVFDTTSGDNEKAWSKIHREQLMHQLQEDRGVYLVTRVGFKMWAAAFKAHLKQTAGINLSSESKTTLHYVRFAWSSDNLSKLAEWAEKGKLKVDVTERVEFTQAGLDDATKRVLSNSTLGKVVIRVGAE